MQQLLHNPFEVVHLGEEWIGDDVAGARETRFDVAVHDGGG